MRDNTNQDPLASTATATGRRESVSDLLKDLRDETTTLIRQEVALAKTEMAEKASWIGRNAAYAAVGALVALVGVLFVLQAVVALTGVGLVALGVSERQALWLAPLIVGGIIAIIGAVLVSKGVKAVKRVSLMPEKTIDSLKEDKAWIQHKAR